MTTLAFDSAVTFRWHDEDGRMHVDRSNLTRVQVAPYYGREIPDSERLGLDPEKIYYGYRPAEELSDPETVRSVIGIPIQLNHHLDYPNAPAKDTRVGSTGDSAKFDGTYLSNSLHIQDADACARIRDGSMRQLSLAYHYKPEMRSGEWNGQTYDFIMRRIRGQHLALVEEGRAGSSCIVEDHALEQGEKAMSEETPIKAGDAPEVEETEVRIADEIGRLADDLRDLHETTETGEIVDNETAVTEDTDKAAKIEAIVEAFKQRGATDEEAAALLQALNELATAEPQAADEEVDPTAATDEEAEAEKAEEVNPVVEAAKAAGVDADNPEVLKAFEAGMRPRTKSLKRRMRNAPPTRMNLRATKNPPRTKNLKPLPTKRSSPPLRRMPPFASSSRSSMPSTNAERFSVAFARPLLTPQVRSISPHSSRWALPCAASRR